MYEVCFSWGCCVSPLIYLRPYIEYCCYVWAGAPRCYLEMLHKLQERISRTVGPLLAAFLKPLAHRQNVASLSDFYRYYCGRCTSELAQLVPLTYSQGSSTCYSDRLHNVSVTIPRCFKDVYVSSFFPKRNCQQALEFPAYRMLSFDIWSSDTSSLFYIYDCIYIYVYIYIYIYILYVIYIICYIYVFSWSINW